LQGLNVGESVRKAARQMMPSRRTIGRWRQWVEEKLALHALHLRSRFAPLGRA
jgi:hypothetical protein